MFPMFAVGGVVLLIAVGALVYRYRSGDDDIEV